MADAGIFDYVIAGGGTAGCVLAARLSEHPDVTVCLIEAGPTDVGDQNILPLSEWMHLLDSGYDWDYPIEPQEKGNSFMRHARAKVLGGCSSHNSCIAFHPPAECLDEWVEMGCTGWSAAEILPLVKRLETNDAPGDHGHDGPVRLQDVPPNDPCGVAVLEAAALAGLPTVGFNRGETVHNGAGWFQINVGEDGSRMSTSHAYLHPILDSRKNLEVRTGCWVSEILFDDANGATGVRYQRPDLTGYDTVSARREVIVTAGSIDTPKLLMLSGIGPAEHLREIGVPVRVDSPGVGSNLDDHVEGLVFWEASKPMVTTSTQWWEIGLFTTVDEGTPQPDLMMHYGSVPFDMNTLRRGYPTTDNGFCLTPNVTQGRSRGTVRLRSLDYRDRPKVDPRYFTDPEGYDERIMLTGIRLARKIAEQAPLKEWISRELAPGAEATTDDELLDYVHKTHNTVYHPAATARMGAVDDPMAVLDPELRVKGVSRLRVVDASAMPKLPAVNPNISVMTMAEKCADLIRGDLSQFLGEHTPFQSMSPEELAELAGGSTVVAFPTDAMIADYAAYVPDEVWMVRTGHVTLQAADGSAIDTVESGGIFGYTPLLTGGGMEFVARATEPSTLIRLPGEEVRAQFAKPAGLAFLASSAWSISPGNRPALVPVADSRPVGEMVHGDVLLVAPDVSVRDAVVRMTDHRVSYALVTLPDGEYGIFTDRDLRTRVVAAGLSVEVPISRVMSAPARRVTADLTAETVLMQMLESGLRHMPVTTTRGAVIGVLEDADLLAASARQSFVLRRSIGLAADAAELQAAAQRVTHVASALFRSGTNASATSGILSVVIDSVVRRALELSLAEAAENPAEPGTPTSGFAWLTLGSIARREAMPSSDVDSALSWRDELSPASGRLRLVAQRTHAILDGCGLPSDSNGAIASSPNFARSQTDWATAAAGWLDDPLAGKGLIMSSLLLDGRVVWGDRALHTVPAAYRRMRAEHPNALRLQLLEALSGRVRTRSVRDVLSRRGGTFDLKSHAVTPIVNLARWGGLAGDVASASTPARLSAAAASGALTERDAATLGEVFAMLQRLRMTHQVEQLSAGNRPGDVVTMSELSPLNRSLLGDGLREIAAVRRRVGNFGIPAG